jgi:O-antigen/teichoic acid export membrane protein
MSAITEAVVAGSLSDTTTRTQIRGSGLLVIGYLLELAINFTPHLLLVRYLSTTSYGAWAYALSLITAFQTFTLCLNDGLQRFVPIYHEQREYGKLLGSITVAFAGTLLIGSAFIAAFYLAPHTVARLVKEKEALRLLFLLVILVPIEAVEVMLMRLFACFSRARQIFYLQHVMAPLGRLFLVVLLIACRKNLAFLALGRIAIAIPTTILYGWLLVRLMHQEGLFRGLRNRLVLPCREMLVFSSPMIVATALSTIENALLVLLLDRSHGITAVAFYRVVLPLATLNNMVMNAFSWLYVPSASRLLAKEDYSGINHLYWRTAAWISVLTFPIFAITFCFAQPLTTFLYGQRYAESGVILAVLAIANYSNVALGFNGVTLKVLGKIRYVLISNLSSAAVKVTLFLILIPRFGAAGAALAVATGIVMYNLLMQLGLRCTVGVKLFAPEYLPFSLLIAFSAACLFSLRSFTGNNIYVAGAFTAIASWAVLMSAKKQLSIAEIFPEARRLPLLGRLLA